MRVISLMIRRVLESLARSSVPGLLGPACNSSPAARLHLLPHLSLRPAAPLHHHAAVSKAFTCLSDPAKRRHYDAYGREEGAVGGGGGGMRRGGGGFPYGDMEIDPEELFNMWVDGVLAS